MSVMTVEDLVILGTVAFSMTASDLLNRLLKRKKAEAPALSARSAATSERHSKATLYLGSAITVAAWGLAAILHARHSDPLRTVPSSMVKTVIVAVLLGLGVITQALLIQAKTKLIKKRKSENRSLTTKDLETLEVLRTLQWTFLLLIALGIGAALLTHF